MQRPDPAQVSGDGDGPRAPAVVAAVDHQRAVAEFDHLRLRRAALHAGANGPSLAMILAGDQGRIGCPLRVASLELSSKDQRAILQSDAVSRPLER